MYTHVYILIAIILEVFFCFINKMGIGMDPSYFQDIRVDGDHVHNKEENKHNESVELDEHNESVELDNHGEEVFYEKGHNSKVECDGDTIIIYGTQGESDIHIDLAGAKKIVRKLKDKYDTTPIKDLPPSTKKKFEELHELLDAFENTPAYEHIYNMIHEEYKCVRDKHYDMGTVGAYFCECQNSTDFPGTKSCSLGCLLGMHPEGGCDGFYPCEYGCYIYNGDETFTCVNSVKTSEEGYIFVNDKYMFLGFTSREIKHLKGDNIKRVKIVKHSNGLKYQEISSDFVDVDNLRLVKSTSETYKLSSTQNKNTLMIIIIIVIIAILIFGLWCLYKGRRH